MDPLVPFLKDPWERKKNYTLYNLDFKQIEIEKKHIPRFLLLRYANVTEKHFENPKPLAVSTLTFSFMKFHASE